MAFSLLSLNDSHIHCNILELRSDAILNEGSPVLFFRKKISLERFATIFVADLPTRIVDRFSKQEQVWVVRASPNRVEKDLKREWIAFNMFMIHCSSVAALETRENIEIFSKTVILRCGKQFVDISVFSDIEEFMRFLNSRFASYEQALQNTGPLGVPVYVGMVYGESCGQGQNPADIYVWAICFNTMTKIYRDIITEMLKQYRFAR